MSNEINTDNNNQNIDLKTLSISSQKGFSFVNYGIEVKLNQILTQLRLSESVKPLFSDGLMKIVFARSSTVFESACALKATNIILGFSVPFDVVADEESESKILDYLEKNKLDWTEKAADSAYLGFVLTHKAKQFVKALNLPVDDVESVASHLCSYLENETDLLERTLFDLMVFVKDMQAKFILDFSLSEMMAHYSGKDFSDIPIQQSIELAA